MPSYLGRGAGEHRSEASDYVERLTSHLSPLHIALSRQNLVRRGPLQHNRVLDIQPVMLNSTYNGFAQAETRRVDRVPRA